MAAKNMAAKNMAAMSHTRSTFTMPPKANPKAVAGRERKEAAEEAKRAAKEAEKRKKEDEEWVVGTKSGDKEKLEAEKKAAKAAAKKEREALEAKEAKELEAMKKAKPSTAARGEDKKAAAITKRVESFSDLNVDAPEYEARSIDAALDLLTLATDSPGAAGASTDKLDRHPERRVKAAYAAYEEKNLPLLKEEFPGLRLSQLKEKLFKQWQKAPENPMNQLSGRYDMTAEEHVELAQAHREAVLDSMRVDSERQQRRLDGTATPERAKRGGKSRASAANSDDDSDGSA